MTEEEARKMILGVEALVRAGRGICSRSTFDSIASILNPTQMVNRLSGGPVFCGVELCISPYIQDGVILPWPQQDVWGKPKFKDW